jgi:4,4'-diaponeurosporenoate glycosyltransferase
MNQAVSVVIPARNEENNIVGLVESVPPNSVDVIVVDDHSTDQTAIRAARTGARVVSAPPLPDGWTGKCWACHTGQTAASSDSPDSTVLVFIDADVRLAPGALERIGTHVSDGTLVSVQPWHDAGAGFEQLSVIPNLIALMGAGAFSVFGRPARLAFGPVLAMTRAGYEQSGGFEAVRGEPVEDTALAQRFGHRVLLTGRDLATFRMHTSVESFINGWSRVLRTGVRHGSWFGTIAAGVWVAALIAGFTSPWIYLANVVGLASMSRVAGRFRPPIAALYPLALAAFVALCARSLVSRRVQWKGRQVQRPSRGTRSLMLSRMSSRARCAPPFDGRAAFTAGYQRRTSSFTLDTSTDR